MKFKPTYQTPEDRLQAHKDGVDWEEMIDKEVEE